MAVFSAQNFLELARPAMLWSAVFVNLVYTLVVAAAVMLGYASLTEATAIMVMQLGSVTVPAATYVFTKSQEKTAAIAANVAAAPVVPPTTVNGDVTITTAAEKKPDGAG